MTFYLQTLAFFFVSVIPIHSTLPSPNSPLLHSLIAINRSLLGWPKFCYAFSLRALVLLSFLNFTWNNFVRLYCDSCHISMHLKKLIKIGEFLSRHFNIKDGRGYTTFQHIMFYYFKKGKNTTETKMEKVLWLIDMSKVVCEVSWYYWHFGQITLCCGAVLCTGRCLAAPLASTHQKPIAGDSWHTQNIQINS